MERNIAKIRAPRKGYYIQKFMANLVSKFEYYSFLKILVIIQCDAGDASQHIPRAEELIILVRQRT
jgi:hypothetical protein